PAQPAGATAVRKWKSTLVRHWCLGPGEQRQSQRDGPKCGGEGSLRLALFTGEGAKKPRRLRESGSRDESSHYSACSGCNPVIASSAAICAAGYSATGAKQNLRRSDRAFTTISRAHGPKVGADNFKDHSRRNHARQR